MTPRVVQAIVDSAIRIRTADIGEKATERVLHAFSRPNPDYVQRRRMRRSTYGVSARFSCASTEREWLRVPRAANDELCATLQKDNIKPQLEDQRIFPRSHLGDTNIQGWDHQIEVARCLERQTQGHVVIPTGGGKTRAALIAILQLQTPTLILVHTKELAKQWCAAAEEHLGIKSAQYSGAKRQSGLITVATIQSLWRDRDSSAFLSQFGFVVVDECHHTPAMTFRSVVDKCPAKYRLGLTATPEREDGLTALLTWYLGPSLVEVSFKQLAEKGIVVLPAIYSVPTSFSYPYKKNRDWHPMVRALCEDPARNALIHRLVSDAARKGLLSLVLSGRKDHCEALGAQLAAVGIKGAVLTGDKKESARTEAIQEALAGRLQVIIATSLADEGLDIPPLSRLLLTYPCNKQGTTRQRLGRLVRPHPDAPSPILYDITDTNVPILRGHFRERKKLYEEILDTEVRELRLKA